MVVSQKKEPHAFEESRENTTTTKRSTGKGKINYPSYRYLGNVRYMTITIQGTWVSTQLLNTNICKHIVYAI